MRNQMKGEEMIKGCKHYFTMFGMMLCAINTAIMKFFSQIFEQLKKYIPIQITLANKQLQQTLQKNQTYQG